VNARGGGIITFTQTEIKAFSLVSNERRSRLNFGERLALFEFFSAKGGARLLRALARAS
jgi:hypothetical protein